MAQRPCLDCRRPTPNTRCAACHRAYRQRYNHAWQQTSKATREAQPWCSWCGATSDLCADHLVPGDPSKGVVTACRSCNSKRARGSL